MSRPATSSPTAQSRAQSWDELADWWRATFTDGADPEYELQILPLAEAHLTGCHRVLDIGCGEGQLGRRLDTTAGARSNGSGPLQAQPQLVVGLDPYRRQLANALAKAGGAMYVQAAGERLPFASSSFDAVVCCLVIEHANDPDAVLAEVARVVAPGGRFLLLVNHPVVQGPGSGFVDDRILDERYWRIGPYLPEQVTVEEVDPGVKVAFAHRPLSRYVNPLTERGLVLTRLEEPAPPREFLTSSLDLELEMAMPRLCLMRFERR